MKQAGFSVAPSRGQFNTLAQIGTGLSTAKRKKRPITVNGNGSEIGDKTTFANRAKRKVITQSVVMALIEVAKKKGDENWVKAYRNTYYCQNYIVSAGGKSYGNYCKNRFCTVCSGNRKADIINRYMPVLEQWEEPYFVTLTARSVYAKTLNSRFERMILAIERVFETIKKRHQRGKGIKVECIRSLECNFNPQTRTYNPHFHLIVSSKEGAEIILKEWLKKKEPTHATRAAQNMRPVTDKTKDLVEVVKYGSKIFTDPTMKKNAKRKVSPYIYASAFHNIIKAMHGHRLFERFGFNLPKSEKTTKRTKLTEYENLLYDPSQNDWVNADSLEVFTNYKPKPELLALLQNNIDMELD